jgi:glycerol-3-phosphate O-acyltransferase
VVLEQAPAPDEKLALEKIAFQVAVEANKVTPITLPALVSMTLLGTYPRALTEHEVIREVDALHRWCVERELRISPDFDHDFSSNMQQQLNLMIDEGIVVRYDDGPETVYGIVEGQAPVASYYRNTIVHFFVNKAITELALIATARAPADDGDHSDVFWREVDDLRDLFKFEFFYPPSDVFQEEIRDELRRVNENWEQELARGVSGARKLLLQMTPQVAHMTLQMFTEAYSVAADVMVTRPDVLSDQKEFVDLCMRYGKQAYLQRRVSSDASVGKLLFQNAWKSFAARKLIDESRSDYAAAREQQARVLSELVRQVEISRASSIASRGIETLRDTARGTL